MANAGRPAGGSARIEEVFAERLAEHPDAIAVEDDAHSLTYAQLWDAAGEVAEALADDGVAPGGLVGLRTRRGWRAVVGILGIWRHGSGYVPVDPRYPKSRRAYIVEDVGLRHVVVEDPDGTLAVESAAGGSAPGHDVPSDAAYVIHTSGSTGDPKGVLIRHSQILALLDACSATYDVGPEDVWSFFHSHSFDFSVWEIWGALLSGGRVVVVPHEAATDSAAFVRLLADRGVTVLSQVPSVFGFVVRSLEERPLPLPRLRYVVFGGEAVGPQVLLRWYDLALAPNARLYNMYGITEITVHATVKLLSPAELRAPGLGTPIGAPLPGLRLALLEDGRPVPPGLPGEIHIAGAQVADGYLGRPDLTAQRFLRVPGLGEDVLWYRSGDYAVERPDGEYEFLGRRDDQVKIRGFRIELGEIESVLAGQPEVRECAVVVTESIKGDPVLAACFVPAAAAGPAPEAEIASVLRHRLAALLPKHMVPGLFVPVRELPVTMSGKLDRGALAKAAGGHFS
ncbi:amino acid adenylation domain-containing protein [Streptomyces sp. SID3343]|uniref:amino acid adenylation domain-containing protein n=1 Tax=Streptomyces sp. SID3343 TaxID=2690260 RepID=UPI0013717B9B|nr:amino acid adenylation domain-containing protein [Streptomyces sp. SID3343]MYW01629.1 amino acid adenylation domain-containing protein [Streptomyces sp. SID3343]